MPKERARQLRKAATPTEKKLWSRLRNRRFAGFKFRRQQSIGPFYVDLFCAEAKLILELDGESHVGNEKADLRRTQWLQKHGYKVIHVWDTEVYSNLEKVMEIVYFECVARTTATRATDAASDHD